MTLSGVSYLLVHFVQQVVQEQDGKGYCRRTANEESQGLALITICLDVGFVVLLPLLWVFHCVLTSITCKEPLGFL